MNMKKHLNYFLGFVLVASLLNLSACKKDDPQPNEFDYVNSWILDNMKEAYYWTD
jgi:hypothetical protein